ncbi:MAG: hypothetical protein RL653_2766 [Pseudomonadota bacterium]|jgi:hypothetical protein
MEQPLFADDQLDRLPLPLYRECLAMRVEISTHGEEHSADETARAIEEAVAYVGRLYVAEYLAALSTHPAILDADLNADIFERLTDKKPLLTGAWLGLSRRVRERFVATQTSPVTEGLLDWNPGQRDEQTPLARLLHFRNEFAHGSFLANLDDIRTHRQLLHDALAAVPGLLSQVPIAKEAESGAWFAQDGAGRKVPTPAFDAPAGHPVVPGARRVNLYPLLQAVHLPARKLAPPDATAAAALQQAHPALGAWAERYERERQGDLHSEELVPAGTPPSDFNLREALSTHGLVLVSSPPGSVPDRLFSSLGPTDPWASGLGAFSEIVRLRIQRGDVTQSGLSVARALVRAVERVLGERSGSRQVPSTDVLKADGPLASALEALAKANKRILLLLGNLHEGTTPYRGEPLTVQDVWNFLAGRPVTVVATAWPGSLGRAVFDRALRLPFPDAGKPEAKELSSALAKLLRGDPLRRRVLEVVVAQPEPVDLFAVCDALDAGAATPVFEPAVERALWDLEPVLGSARAAAPAGEERVRRWTPLSPAVRDALSQMPAGGAP